MIGDERKTQEHLLVFDIDKTILQAKYRTQVKVVGIPKRRSNLVESNGNFHFIFRQGLFDLLIMAHAFCNIILYTAGSTSYAARVARLVNKKVAALSYIKLLYFFCFVLICST